VLLGLDADEERGDVDNLLADADVALTDEDTGVMDGLGETVLEDLGLETTLHDLGGGQTEDIIQLALGVGEETETLHAAKHGLTLEDAGLILLVESQQDTGGGTDAGEGVLDAPDLTLILEAVFTDALELGVQTLLLKRALGLTETLRAFAEGLRFHTHGCDKIFPGFSNKWS